MKLFYRMKFSFVLILMFIESSISQIGRGRKTRCLKIPTFPKKVENVIKLCSNEVKSGLIDDLVNAGEVKLKTFGKF